MRRLGSLVVVLMLAALAACGGGGGDSDTEAFCDDAQDFSDDFENLDPSDAEGLESATDRLEDLADNAPEEIEDDVETLSEAFGGFARAFADADEGDPVAQLEAVQRLFEEHSGEEIDEAVSNLQDFAQEECDLEIESGDTSFEEIEGQLEGVEIPEDGGDDGGDDGGGDGALPDPTEPPETDDPELESLIEGCQAGDMETCDDLFLESPTGSAEEEYGNTCGGREPDPQGQLCVTIFPG